MGSCNGAVENGMSSSALKGGWFLDYLDNQFNVHGVKDVRQAEIHTAEPLVPEPSAAEVELAIKYRQN